MNAAARIRNSRVLVIFCELNEVIMFSVRDNDKKGGVSLEAFLCRDSKQFLAGSTAEFKDFSPPTLPDFDCLEPYIAGSANWKLSLAESSNEDSRRPGSVQPRTMLHNDVEVMSLALRG